MSDQTPKAPHTQWCGDCWCNSANQPVYVDEYGYGHTIDEWANQEYQPPDATARFDWDESREWDLKHIQSRAFGPAEDASLLTAAAAAWIQSLEDGDDDLFVLPVGFNFNHSEDGFELIVSVEVS